MFKYLEHEADMGILAVGESWPEVFNEGAKAVFNLMHEIKVRSQPACAGRKLSPPLKREDREVRSIKIKAVSCSIEELFVEWLNELLAQESINNLIFLDFVIKAIKERQNKFELNGSALGIDSADFHGEMRTEVKAATYAGLKCGQKDKKYFCQCVVDV